MLRFCAPRVRHSQLRTAWRRPSPLLARVQHVSSAAAVSSKCIATTADLQEFIAFEKTLQKIKLPSTSLDTKIKFLLSNPTKIDISDLNLSDEDSALFFVKLVSTYNTDFNTVEILGLGKLLKILPNISLDGLTVVKNCGILGSTEADTDAAASHAADVFTNKYNDKLQRLTIDTLITHKCYREAYHFLKLYDELKQDRRTTVKFHFKLSRFSEFSKDKGFKISAREIVDSNLVHLYMRELLKSESMPLKQKLEKFLLILYKWLNYIAVVKHKRPSENQIHVINTTFLSILSLQKGISYSVFLGYFVNLYPKSIPLLHDLSLLTICSSSTSSSSQNHAPVLSELPQVNIRKELVQSSQPYMEELSMLYSKYLREMFPDKSYTKTLYKKYHDSVLKFQRIEASKLVLQSNHFRHPFSRSNHDSSILAAFIHHTFENPMGIPKPALTANIVESFYSDLKVSSGDFYKSNTHKSHIQQLSSLVCSSLRGSFSKRDIEISLRLFDLLTRANIFLDIDAYLKMIDLLIRLDFLNDAKKIYMFILEHPVLSDKLTKEQIAPWCYRYSWPFPEHLLIFPPVAKGQLFTYDKNFLSGDMSPAALIGHLDLLVEAQTSVNEN